MKNIFVLLCGLAMATADSCGVSKGPSGFVVKGTRFERGDFPWIVALMYKSEASPPLFFCGGTLISSTFVLSAAHCILPKQGQIALLPREVLSIFGAHDLNNHYEPERLVLSPKKIIIHDEWNPLTTQYDADISLLEFEKGKILFNDNSLFIRPICMALESEPPVKTGIVAGWGKSEDLTKNHETIPTLVAAKIQTNEECFLGQKSLLDLSSFRTFCAGLQNGSGVCFGDSGSGLFIEVNRVHYLKGIVSSSLVKDNHCDVSKNAVYTNVPRYADWIESKTQIVFQTLIRVFKKVYCNFRSLYTGNPSKLVHYCSINEGIEDEDFELGMNDDKQPLGFNVEKNKNLKYLPRSIGRTFPDLETFTVWNCSLTIIRDFNFKGLRKLRYVNLIRNSIASIEKGSFDDLTSLQELYLGNNQLATLDELLFAPLIKLKIIDLTNNKIKVLKPTTFEIPNGQLRKVVLSANVCISKSYDLEILNQLKTDLENGCGPS